MTGSLRSCPTRTSPRTPTSIRGFLSNAKGGWVQAAIGVGVLAFASACAGRNIHSDLRADPHVLVRKWTLSTHGLFEAGDRGTEYSNPVMAENSLVFGNRSVGLVALYPTINAQR